MARIEENTVMGDEETFRQIVHSYGPILARYVRHRIVNPSDAEDVLQEILVAVWLGFKSLRDPDRTHSWLMQLAQNRCRDYFRVQQRRDVPLEEETLHNYANRYGLHHYRQTQRLTDIVDALETAPLAAREAARRFYLEGLSIAEIAAESDSPLGTVKRQLFQARLAARAFLGIASPAAISRTEKPMMTTKIAQTMQNTVEDTPKFPLTRPEIRITELNETPFTVDCQELRSFPIIPRVGERAASADYFMPEWKVDEMATMQALRMGQVHDVDGVEIEVRVWKPEAGWQRPGTIYGRLTEDKAEFLAVHLPHENFTQVETFLDSSFAMSWGTLDRAISDQGLVQRTSDRSFLLSDTVAHQHNAGLVLGVVQLKVSGKTFTCLRILDGDISKTDTYLTESYLTSEGRTVLVRRFCLPRFAEVAQFPVVLDQSEQLTINGIAFVHWYDSVTNIGLSDV